MDGFLQYLAIMSGLFAAGVAWGTVRHAVRTIGERLERLEDKVDQLAAEARAARLANVHELRPQR